MSLDDEIAKAQGDPAALEALYKRAEAADEVEAFKEAIAGCVREDPDSLLLAAWRFRSPQPPFNSYGGRPIPRTHATGPPRWP